MKMLLTAAVLMASLSAQAQSLAVYIGPIQNVMESEFLVGKGTWKSVPKKCIPYVRGQDIGFSATASDSIAGSKMTCNRAEITLDLEGSSFCQNQGGREIYFSPTIVSIKCF